MNVSRLRTLIKEGKSGKFRRLKCGETVEPADILICDTYIDTVVDKEIGKPCNDRDVIVRLEFV